MEERYHRHSTIIITNLVYDEWPNFLGNRVMVEALLSRLRHYCPTVGHPRSYPLWAFLFPSWTIPCPLCSLLQVSGASWPELQSC